MERTMTPATLPTILALLMSASALSASPQISPQNAREVMAASLADLRGVKETVEASPTSEPLRLRESAGTISAKRLRHQPPRAARKAYEKASRSKDVKEKAAQLERAIALDPDYVEAHNDLGVAYVHLGRNSEGASEFRRAIALAPEEPLPHSNLAWVLRVQ